MTQNISDTKISKYGMDSKSRKDGLSKKYGGTSVLNQVIPSLTEELGSRYPRHTHVTNGWNTKEFREKHELEKDHDIDAYCIAASKNFLRKSGSAPWVRR